MFVLMYDVSLTTSEIVLTTQTASYIRTVFAEQLLNNNLQKLANYIHMFEHRNAMTQ